MPNNKLKLTLPKGSLWETTSKLLTEAGYQIGDVSRSYRPSINDPEIELKLLRPQEIPEYIADGQFDLGISGKDWVNETNAKVVEVMDLNIGKVRIVFCIPTFWDEKITTFDAFLSEFVKQNKTMRISTEYINTVINFIMKCPTYAEKFGKKKPMVYTPWHQWGENTQVKIFLSFGATEAKPPEEVDCIFDNTETGTTIKENNLRIVQTIDNSSALLIANPKAMQDEFKREKINDIKLLVNGVLQARNRLHVFMNCLEENVETICKMLPALKRPTVSTLFGAKGWVALNTIIEKKDFLPLIPKLKKIAQGLVVLTPRQVITLIDENGDKN